MSYEYCEFNIKSLVERCTCGPSLPDSPCWPLSPVDPGGPEGPVSPKTLFWKQKILVPVWWRIN